MITVLDVSALKYTDETHSTIDCTVDTQEYGVIPMTIDPSDESSHIVDLRTDIHAGVYGAVMDYSPTDSFHELQELLTLKIAEIDAAMRSNVQTEFQSSALGSVHSYDCLDTDQRNILLDIASVQASGGTVGYMAKPTGGHYSLVQHTEAQLQGVLVDMKNHIDANRLIARTKKAQVYAAHDASDMTAMEAVDVTDWS